MKGLFIIAMALLLAGANSLENIENQYYYDKIFNHRKCDPTKTNLNL